MEEDLRNYNKLEGASIYRWETY